MARKRKPDWSEVSGKVLGLATQAAVFLTAPDRPGEVGRMALMATAGPYSAIWTCKDDDVVMHWSQGYTDRLRLSGHATHLEGTNGIITVTEDRK